MVPPTHTPEHNSVYETTVTIATMTWMSWRCSGCLRSWVIEADSPPWTTVEDKTNIPGQMGAILCLCYPHGCHGNGPDAEEAGVRSQKQEVLPGPRWQPWKTLEETKWWLNSLILGGHFVFGITDSKQHWRGCDGYKFREAGSGSQIKGGEKPSFFCNHGRRHFDFLKQFTQNPSEDQYRFRLL